MKLNTFYKKYENLILSVSAILILAAVVVLRYDLIYELNDDTVIRNLLSGSYTGNPTAMNNQMMYAFSAVLSVFYKIIPSVQWFEVFFILCQYMCIWMILYRMLEYCNKTTGKIVTTVAYLTFVFTFLFNHIVLSTYTVTSGMLAVAAVFLFVTEKDNDKLYIKSLPSILLSVLAFCIRSELLIMLLPFVCMAGVYRWSKEKVIFSADNFKKYFGIFGTLIVLIAVVFVSDNVAYSSAEWQDFRSFFDARTTVYDYTYIPSYEDNTEFYNSHNISREQYLLLESYDYVLDESINSEMMNDIAEYAQAIGAGIGDKLYKGVMDYKNQIIGNIGTAYHTLALVGYIVVFMAVNRNNKIRVLLLAAMAFAGRSVIWVYLHGQGRTPDRITHPLYWCEFGLLVAVFIVENSGLEKANRIKNIIGLLLIASVCSLFFVPEYTRLNNRYNNLYEKAQTYETVHKYCLDNGDNFYFTPIFSMAVYPEMVFDGSEEPENFDIMGGWFVKSPSHREKMEKHGITAVDKALLDNDNVYIIQHRGYVSAYTEYPFQWLESYYSTKGYNVEVVKTDTIVDDIEVYKIELIN